MCVRDLPRPIFQTGPHSEDAWLAEQLSRGCRSICASPFARRLRALATTPCSPINVAIDVFFRVELHSRHLFSAYDKVLFLCEP